MKRVGGLWEGIVSFEGLHRAATEAARGQRRGAGASGFLFNIEPEIFRL